MDLSGHEADIPTPIASTYVVHNTSLNKTNEDQASLSNNNNNKKKIVVAKVVKYRECLKNHAASMGGNATDGCGEFMPSGEEGTLESFMCSACNCHRNFHRKEVEGEPFSCGNELFHYNFKGRYMPSPQPPPALIMPLGAIHSSESDEIGDGYNFGYGGGMVRAPPGSMVRTPPGSMVRKRIRTKFTQEQKEKMLSFAEKVGWKLQRQEEGLVHQLCQEIGVKRRVLKVWMHNNKHSLAKKDSVLQIDQ